MTVLCLMLLYRGTVLKCVGQKINPHSPRMMVRPCWLDVTVVVVAIVWCGVCVSSAHKLVGRGRYFDDDGGRGRGVWPVRDAIKRHGPSHDYSNPHIIASPTTQRHRPPVQPCFTSNTNDHWATYTHTTSTTLHDNYNTSITVAELTTHLGAKEKELVARLSALRAAISDHTTPTSQQHTRRASRIEPVDNAVDRAALEALYNATGGPEGYWGINYQGDLGQPWLTHNTSYCRWSHVQCEPFLINNTFYENRVIYVTISAFNLTGVLVPEICTMDKLLWLSVNFNQLLVGSIPECIGRDMPQLKYLEFTNTGLTGQFPPIVNLPNLTSLAVSLPLRGTGPNGLISDMGNLTQLQSLTMTGFGLYGILAEDNPICGMAAHLTSLRLDNNQLHRPLPKCFRNLKLLTAISLSSNPLNVRFPPFLLDLPLLQAVSLDNCGLNGSLPLTLPPLLTSISLTSNDLSGELPNWNASSPKLIFIDLQDNQLSGSPAVLCNLMALQGIYLNYNRFSGKLPICLLQNGLTHYLQYAALDHNQLSGTLPELRCPVNASCANPMLYQILLSYNQFEGTIPESYFQWKPLWLLELNNNRLTGSLPAGPFNNTVVSEVFLHSNHLTGELSADFLKIPTLRYTSLDHNNISGSVPVEIYGNHSIIAFSASYNNLEGVLIYNSTLSVNASLVSSDLSYNHLSGSVMPYFYGNQNAAFLMFTGNDAMRAVSREYKYEWTVMPSGEQNFFTGYVCPRLEMIETRAPFDVSPSYYNYTLCQCLPGYFGIPSLNCTECPTNGNCSGDIMTWPRGFYPIFQPNGIPLGFLPCTDATWLDTSDCNPFDNCSLIWYQKQPSCQVCARGSSDRLCSRCTCETPSDCYYRKNNRCIACESPSRSYSVIGAVLGSAGIVLIVIFALNYFWPVAYKQLKEAFDTVSESGTLKVMLIFVQSTAALNVVWPDWISEHVMQYLQLSNGQAFALGLTCVLPVLADPVNEQLAYLLIIPLLTVGLIFLIAFAYAFKAIAKQCRVYVLPFVDLPAISQSSRRLWGLSNIVDDGDCDGASVSNNHRSLYGNYNTIISSTPHPRKLSDIGTAETDGSPQAKYASPIAILSWRWGVFAWLFILYFFFFDLSNRALRVFNCIQDPWLSEHASHMQSLPWIHCSLYVVFPVLCCMLCVIYVNHAPSFYDNCLRFAQKKKISDDSRWQKLTGIAITMLIVYTLGIPLLFGTLLWRYRLHTQQPLVRGMLSILYYSYRPDRYWYELFIIVRRLILAILISVVERDSIYRPSAITSVLLLFIAIQCWAWPFKKRRDNVLEVLALSTLTITFVAQTSWWDATKLLNPSVGLFAQVLPFPQGSRKVPGNEVLLPTIATLNLALLLVMLVTVVWPVLLWFWRLFPVTWRSRLLVRLFSCQPDESIK
eukprot:TRINITY_DN2168_c0_g1_i1.p1 TRINITY_DN2168_c0_g1~~TRINITY_DN2168_c0_g1_i1.p1  ORF type:complete len:1403 (-),score=152.50 TRINITY_DN2168_c0_g1_i1:21-4229(-)